MSECVKIEPRIWNQEWFATLSEKAKLLFLFLWSHLNRTGLGAMRATVPGLAEELNWSVRKCQDALGELSAQELIRWCELTYLVWLPRFLDVNRPDSAEIVAAWRPLADQLPEGTLREDLLTALWDQANWWGTEFAEVLPFELYPRAKVREILKEHAGKKAAMAEESDQDETTSVDAPESCGVSHGCSEETGKSAGSANDAVDELKEKGWTSRVLTSGDGRRLTVTVVRENSGMNVAVARSLKERLKRIRLPKLDRLRLPRRLRTDLFRTTWKKWESHLRGVMSPLDSLERSRHLQVLEQLGADESVRSMERSIERRMNVVLPRGSMEENDTEELTDERHLKSGLTAVGVCELDATNAE